MLLAFLAHKAALIGALLAAPQFDISSEYLLEPQNALQKLQRRLLTWDNVYYTSLAGRGVAYEHELAFSPRWAWILHQLSPSNDAGSLALTAAVVASTAHLLATFALVYATKIITKDPKLAKTTGYIYVVSPAGIFLASGYPESVFALLSFVGLALFYKKSYAGSGVLFGAASLLRGNGLLWGILYAVTVLQQIYRRRVFTVSTLALIIGGALVGLGFVYPQIDAYLWLCPGRPWCEATVPSIYSYVQAKYWNVGFLQYWTPNNASNFLFAMPTLLLLALSMREGPLALQLVQLALFVGALFFWHVQIVTRVASCLPAPYWYVARRLKRSSGKCWLAYFIIWSIVQAALFGAFLPPA